MPLARVPTPPLSHFVQMLWLYEEVPPMHERRLPSGAMELVIGLGANPMPAVIGGARTESFPIDTAEPMTVAGIVFKPGAAAAFFRQPATEFTGIDVSLADAIGDDEFSERVLGASDANAALDAIEGWLLDRLTIGAPDGTMTWAVDTLRRLPNTRIADITAQLGFSARRFISRFESETGLTPKAFCRVHRFQRALRRMHGNANVDLGDVALSCGYFDQAHFGHDFKSFSGLTPAAYVALGTQYQNHVPLD